MLQYNAEVVLVWQFRILEHGTKSCVTEHYTMNVYPDASTHAHIRTHARTHKTHTLILNLSTECKKMHTGVVLIWYFLNRNHSIKICYISGSRFIYYYLKAHYISMPITQWQGHTSVHRVYNEWINKNQKL